MSNLGLQIRALAELGKLANESPSGRNLPRRWLRTVAERTGSGPAEIAELIPFGTVRTPSPAVPRLTDVGWVLCRLAWDALDAEAEYKALRKPALVDPTEALRMALSGLEAENARLRAEIALVRLAYGAGEGAKK